MSVWLVRAGGNGEWEDYALTHKVAVIAWNELDSLADISSKESLLIRLQAAYPDSKPKKLMNWQSQIWPFINTIQAGDTIALPLKRRPAVAFGRAEGKYRFEPDAPVGARHQLPVAWIVEVPRSELSQDLLYSLGAFMTVCRISRNGAEDRIQAIIGGKPDPMFSTTQAQEPTDEGVTLDFESSRSGRPFAGASRQG